VRRDIEHLSARDHRNLERAVRILREEFALALRRRKTDVDNPRRILKIILFGSMARGEGVVDVNTGYRSDYDLLVIVSHPELTDDRYWEGAGDALLLLDQPYSRDHPPRFIVHDLDDVNNQLHLGRPFFKDIHRDGIVLYEFNKRELARPGNLTPEEIDAEARMYFEQWFTRSKDASWVAAQCIEGGKPLEAAFAFHQATERAYHCALLTLKLYSPKLHDLERLRAMAEAIEPRLIPAWPRARRWERRPFNRIKRAYVEARYSRHYVITAEDLAAAAERIGTLQELVKQVCEERLASRS